MPPVWRPCRGSQDIVAGILEDDPLGPEVHPACAHAVHAPISGPSLVLQVDDFPFRRRRTPGGHAAGGNGLRGWGRLVRTGPALEFEQLQLAHCVVHDPSFSGSNPQRGMFLWPLVFRESDRGIGDLPIVDLHEPLFVRGAGKDERGLSGFLLANPPGKHVVVAEPAFKQNGGPCVGMVLEHHDLAPSLLRVGLKKREVLGARRPLGLVMVVAIGVQASEHKRPNTALLLCGRHDVPHLGVAHVRPQGDRELARQEFITPKDLPAREEHYQKRDIRSHRTRFPVSRICCFVTFQPFRDGITNRPIPSTIQA